MLSSSNLHSLICSSFDEDELHTLCHDLAIDYADLPANTKSGKARELILLCRRTQHLSDLIAACRSKRPQVPWPSPSESHSLYALVGQSLGFFPPAPPPHCVERADKVRELLDLLIGENNRPIVALYGMAGVGKTVLAQKVSLAVRSHFPAGVLWADLARINGDPLPTLTNWAQLCHRSLGSVVEPHNCATMVRGWLDQVGPLLIVLDDVRLEWFDTAQLLAAVRPDGASLLLTTRERQAAENLYAAVVSLDVFSPGEAIRLLKKLAPVQVRQERETARQLAQRIGFLPLALAIAGSQAGEPGWSLKELYRAIDANAHERLDLEGQRGLDETFAASYQALGDAQQQLFRMLALFSRMPFMAEQVAVVTGLDQQTANKRLNELARRSLLRREPPAYPGGQGHYTLHPLLHDYAGQLGRPSGEEDHHKAEANLAHFLVAAVEPRQVITAGQTLLHLNWMPPNLRSQVLAALLPIMEQREIPEAQRRAAAVLLTQLQWLQDFSSVPFDRMITYLELVTRFVTAPAERWNLVNEIEKMLSAPLALTQRQRVALLVQQAAVCGYLRRFSEARQKYEQARLYVEESLPVQQRTADDHQLAARVYLGLGNLSRQQVRQSAEQRAETLAWYQQALLSAGRCDPAGDEGATLEATIYKEWSHAYVLLQEWSEAEQSYELAVQVAGRIREPSSQASYTARVLETGSFLAYERGQSLEKTGNTAGALSFYNLAYQRAEEGLRRLQGQGEEARLAIAHFNCGDYLLEMSRFANGPVNGGLEQACQHWQAALQLIGETGDRVIKDAAEQQLARYCEEGVSA